MEANRHDRGEMRLCVVRDKILVGVKTDVPVDLVADIHECISSGMVGVKSVHVRATSPQEPHATRQ